MSGPSGRLGEVKADDLRCSGDVAERIGVSCLLLRTAVSISLRGSLQWPSIAVLRERAANTGQHEDSRASA